MTSPLPGPATDQSDAVADLQTAFKAYEAALLRHDVAALNAFFWNDARTLRYGIAEHSQGIAAIREYRAHALPVPAGRQLCNTVITTFGSEFGSVCTEFTGPDTALLGRQTQTWVRFPDGWKIVAAHVSQIDPAHLGKPV